MLGRHDAIEQIFVQVGEGELCGSLGVPQGPVGLVVCAGTGDRFVAQALRARGLATLIVELDPQRELGELASDLVAVSEWVVHHSTLSHLPVGLLGNDCYAAAAAIAAARAPAAFRAIVALGRIDLARGALASVRAPTLLVTDRDDAVLIERDRQAIAQMTTTTQLAIIPSAFEPAMLDEVVQVTAEWFVDHFAVVLQEPPTKRGAWGRQFRDRRYAGERLAQLLRRHAGDSTIVFGLPRGGVVVADEIAKLLDAPLDVWLVRKIGMPIQPELGMGALAEGAALVLDPTVVRWSGATPQELRAIVHRKAEEIRRRAQRYRGDAPALDVDGKTVILVDDGVATGGTLRAAIRGARKRGAARVVVAVPVAAAEAVDALDAEADELVALARPRHLIAVGAWYQDFRQVPDQDVVEILEAARRRRVAAA